MMINGTYICSKCNSTITEMTSEVIKFHEAKCDEWSLRVNPFKSYQDDNNNWFMRGYSQGRFYFNDYPESNGITAMSHITAMMFKGR